MTADSRIEDLIKKYDELLVSRHQQGVVEGLLRVNREENLRQRDGLPLCRALRPFFLSSSTYAEFMQAAETVGRGLHVLCKRVATDEPLRRTLGIPDFFDGALRLEPDSSYPPSWLRLDGFTPGTDPIRFVESNPFPGSFVESDVCGKYFVDSPILRELSDYRFRSLSIADGVVHSVQQRAGMPSDQFPTVAAVKGEPGEFPISEDIPLMENYLGRRGVSFFHGEPSDVSLRNGKLYLRDRATELLVIYPQFIMFELEPSGPLAVLHEAITSGATRLLIGPSVTVVTHNKMSFEVLTDETHAGLFGHELFAALQRHVPWTRVVRERATTFEGKPVDLLPLLSSRREEFVIKPAHGSGGTGVVLGWQASAAEWDAAIATALESPHVAQHRVQTAAHRTYPFLGPSSSVEWSEVGSDLNPYLWYGEGRGCLVRLSPHEISNVAMGGSIAPLVLVD